ncbi:hypothetical protein [Bacillus sp. OAE603]|uniref:hypothetical protein n=1 Tax=Gottfriedia sp. OAE603 TaxID=2663872 RepID=UPI001789E5D7
MKEIEKLTNDYINTEQGFKELEEILSEIEIDHKALVNIENKVLKKINVRQNRSDKIKRKMLLLSAAAILLISTVSYQKDTFRAWASEYFSYLPMFNKPFDHKIDSPIYEFDRYIGDHKNIKINNLAFNSELPYFEIEYEYKTKNKIEGEGFNELFKYWNSLDVYIKINNKKYELERETYGIQGDGLVLDQLKLKSKINRIEKPISNKIQFIIDKNTYTLKLKELEKVFIPNKSDVNKNIMLKTMVRKENDHLYINYLTEKEISPYSYKPSIAYLTDSSGKKVYLNSNENSSTVRYKFKASTKKLDLKTLSLVTPSVLRMEAYENLTWDIPIPMKNEEEILLPELIIPNSNIKIKGARVKRTNLEGDSLVIVMPKQDKNENRWLLDLNMNLVGDKQFGGISAESSGPSNGHFEPDEYIIQLKETNKKSIKINISGATVVENGPWKTDLSNIE